MFDYYDAAHLINFEASKNNLKKKDKSFYEFQLGRKTYYVTQVVPV